MFSGYRNIFNKDVLDFGDQLIDTMVEVVQGPCRKNQTALIAAKVIENSWEFIESFNPRKHRDDLRKRKFNPDDQDDNAEVSEQKQKLVTLLLSLLEGEADEDIIS